ncbi:hypothetical protein DRN62_02215 [Nanoarchaeota archaeon]|nr:MAG: hypothetical protein DRN62_02215 [Nanoarchaeota archaeon]
MTLEEKIKVAVVPTGPREDFVRRLKGALYLYKKGRVDLIMMSGAPSYLDKLATQIFKKYGVEKVLWEGSSRNTTENVWNSLDVLSPLEAEVVFVTNDYHGPRVLREIRRCIRKRDTPKVELFTVKSKGFLRKLIPEFLKMLFPKGPKRLKRYLNKLYL